MLYQYPRGVLALARSQIETDRVREAAATLDSFDSLHAQAAEHADAAVLHLRIGQPEQARRHIEKARTLDPDAPRLHFLTAVALANLGRGSDALEVLRSSAETSSDGRSLNLLGLLAEEQDELELAIHSLRKAIELEPLNEDHYLDLSLLCVKRGNFELGEEILRIGLSELPRSYRLHIQLGAVLERAARRDEAERGVSEGGHAHRRPRIGNRLTGRTAALRRRSGRSIGNAWHRSEVVSA